MKAWQDELLGAPPEIVMLAAIFLFTVMIRLLAMRLAPAPSSRTTSLPKREADLRSYRRAYQHPRRGEGTPKSATTNRTHGIRVIGLPDHTCG